MDLVLITAPILAPLPVEDGRRNSAVVNNVRDALALGSLGVLTDLVYQVGCLIDANAKISGEIDCAHPSVFVRVMV